MVICGGSEGPGGVLSLNVYRGDRHILALGGIQEGGVTIHPRPEAPPDLVITGKLQWLDHKLDPWVTERFTYWPQNLPKGWPPILSGRPRT